MRRKILCAAFPLVFLMICTSTGMATATYDDVGVIVNTNSSSSAAIGNYFRNARSIPVENMIYVAVDTTEEVDSTTFNALRSQVENYLMENNLAGSLNYLVTTKGVPLKVNRGNTFSTNSPSSSVESELMLVLGSYSSSIGGAGRIVSPYYYQNSHFSRSVYGMYLVTRLDAFTLQQVFDMIDRSGPGIYASPSSPFVLDEDPDWNATAPSLNSYMGTATTILGQKGKTVVLDQTSTYVTNSTSVIGYTSWGSNDHYASNYTTHAIPHDSWARGAIAETYVSTSGRSFQCPPTYGQSLIADLLAEGISGAKGYVYEPYTSAMAIPYILFDRYTSGYNLAESFFMASRYVSWMDVVVGDPKTSIDGMPVSPLPIQLCHFEGQPVMGTSTVRLSWGTLSETNNFGFYMQLRDSSDQTFTDIPESFVPGHGTTLEPHEYSWSHCNVAAGTHMYRLRQMDLDGTSHFSDPIVVPMNALAAVEEDFTPDQLRLSQNYPNPFNPSTSISYQNPGRQRVVLRVFDSLGKEVTTLVDATQEAGTFTVPFSARNNSVKLASGVYYYRIEADNKVITRRMILLQ